MLTHKKRGDMIKKRGDMMSGPDKIKALMEYMKKEYGVTPENIDKKLEELKEEFYRRLNSQNISEAI